MRISGDVTIGNTTIGDTIDGVIAALSVSNVSIGRGSTYLRKYGSKWLESHAIELDIGGTFTMKNIEATNF